MVEFNFYGCRTPGKLGVNYKSGLRTHKKNTFPSCRSGPLVLTLYTVINEVKALPRTEEITVTFREDVKGGEKGLVEKIFELLKENRSHNSPE